VSLAIGFRGQVLIIGRRVYYDLGKNEDVILEDGADKLTVHRVNLTE
jgi:hypothetical protein